MKKTLMHTMMGSCKKASFNISRQEEGALPLNRRIQLWIHLRFCEVCRKFAEQSAKINRASKNSISSETLSPEAMQRMKEALKDKS